MNSEYLNGLKSLQSLLQVVNDYYDEVEDAGAFEKAARDIAVKLMSENTSINNCIEKREIPTCGLNIGTSQFTFPKCQRLIDAIKTTKAPFFNGDTLSVPLEVNDDSFCIVEKIDDISKAASLFSQNIITKLISSNKKYYFRCVDLVSGGIFFNSILGAVDYMHEEFGGKIFTKEEEFRRIIVESQKIIEEDLRTNAKAKMSEYEDAERKSINFPHFVYVLHINEYNSEVKKWIHTLLENREKYCLSFIFVGPNSVVSDFDKYSDYSFHVKENQIIEDISDSQISYEKCELPVEKFRSATKKVETDYLKFLKDSKPDGHEEPVAPKSTDGNYSEMFSEYRDKYDRYLSYLTSGMNYLQMDSTKILRIPFALDRNKNYVYLELGDEAAHALISGSTGCGKSVTLHTIIMQTAMNYHPDDVEIWAIDYKAVEFNEYVRSRTPHFKVVAYDEEGSTEFSLSLLDELDKEMQKRKILYDNSGVNNIKDYKEKNGKRSLPRVLVVIDEFQRMTQAVREYAGEKNYRVILENLLREARAFGIHFVFCSQTISSGLEGLNEAARSQIGVRICMKQDNATEIRETLIPSPEESSVIVQKAANFNQGEAFYKRKLLKDEPKINGRSYEYIEIYCLYLNKSIKESFKKQVNDLIGNDFTPKNEIIVKGVKRFPITEKRKHPIMKLLNDGIKFNPDDYCDSGSESEGIHLFPAAPAGLDEYFDVNLKLQTSANMLIVGENDDLRESILIHTVCSALLDENTSIFINVLNENYPDRSRLISLLKNIKSPRIEWNIGFENFVRIIKRIKRIQPVPGKNVLHIWYGLDRAKNEFFLHEQNSDEDDGVADYPEAEVEDVKTNPREALDPISDLWKSLSGFSSESPTLEKVDSGETSDPISDLQKFLSDFSSESSTLEKVDSGEISDPISDLWKSLPGFSSEAPKSKKTTETSTRIELGLDECRNIFRNAVEMGPENGIFHICVFNNYTALKNSGFIKLSDYQNKIAMQMTSDDAYSFLGSGLLVQKANENTVVYSSGGKSVVPLRPYVKPMQEWYEEFNDSIK